MARGINADAVAQEFLQHATEEQGHADLIAGRIAIERQGGMIRRMMEDIPAMKERTRTICEPAGRHLIAGLA